MVELPEYQVATSQILNYPRSGDQGLHHLTYQILWIAFRYLLAMLSFLLKLASTAPYLGTKKVSVSAELCFISIVPMQWLGVRAITILTIMRGLLKIKKIS